MASLRQVLDQHETALVLDAASSLIQVGVIQKSGAATWETSTEEAGIGLFRCLERIGDSAGTAGAYIFCDGPGSILGIRTVAMALRTWTVLKPRPMFAYCSLAIVAHDIGKTDIAAIADARREAWHEYRLGATLRRVERSALTGSLVMPENFRHWSALPPKVQIVPYSLAELLPRVADLDLLTATDAPDAFLHEEPSYVTWTPQIHRAPNGS